MDRYKENAKNKVIFPYNQVLTLIFTYENPYKFRYNGNPLLYFKMPNFTLIFTTWKTIYLILA